MDIAIAAQQFVTSLAWVPVAVLGVCLGTIGLVYAKSWFQVDRRPKMWRDQ